MSKDEEQLCRMINVCVKFAAESKQEIMSACLVVLYNAMKTNRVMALATTLNEHCEGEERRFAEEIERRERDKLDKKVN